MLSSLKKELQSLANPEKAKVLQGFFKTGKGQYGEGDIFLGIIVPEQRKIAKKYDLTLNEIQELLNSKIHEYRMTGLLILIEKYYKAKKEPRKKLEIFEFYLKNTKNINNWDLVDLSAPRILGDYLIDKNRKILYKLVLLAGKPHHIKNISDTPGKIALGHARQPAKHLQSLFWC
jgi:3-methyladenine DNA glycosylase AlkD